jgi:hypothetical protein
MKLQIQELHIFNFLCVVLSSFLNLMIEQKKRKDARESVRWTVKIVTTDNMRESFGDSPNLTKFQQDNYSTLTIYI